MARAAESLTIAVMAAGEGRRLWRLSGRHGRPKLLAPIGGEPILGRFLADAVGSRVGFKMKIWMNRSHPGRMAAVRAYAQGRFPAVELEVQPTDASSTAAALREICRSTVSGPLVLVYSDIVLPRGSLAGVLSRCAVADFDLVICTAGPADGSRDVRVHSRADRRVVRLVRSVERGSAATELVESYAGVVVLSERARAFVTGLADLPASCSRVIGLAVTKLPACSSLRFAWAVNVNTESDHTRALGLTGNERPSELSEHG